MTLVCLRSDDVVGEAFSVMQGSVVGWRGRQLGVGVGGVRSCCCRGSIAFRIYRPISACKVWEVIVG